MVLARCGGLGTFGWTDACCWNDSETEALRLADQRYGPMTPGVQLEEYTRRFRSRIRTVSVQGDLVGFRGGGPEPAAGP